MLKFLLSKTKLRQLKSSPVLIDNIEAPTYFTFFLDDRKQGSNARKQLKALEQIKSRNIVNFYQVKTSGALWELCVSPAKLVCMLNYTIKISFFDFKKHIVKKDIYFFKQLGKFAVNLESVTFVDTDSEKFDANQKLVILATACLMKSTEVRLEEEEEDEYASDGESKQIWERPYEIHEKGYLLMYKLLRANNGLNCLMNHNGKITNNRILKLFGSVCLNNDSQFKKLKESIKNPEFNPLAVFLFRSY